MKPKQCPICEKEFTPTRNMQKVCGPLCSIEYPNWLAEKKQRQMWKRQKQEYREQNRTKPEQEKLTQAAVNGWCNLRDRLRGYTCISCGKVLNWGAKQFGNKTGGEAGHFRSRGSAPHLKFHTGNINGQCTHCNSPKGMSGNYLEYEKGLEKRYGKEHVERIKSDQRPRHYTIVDLKRIATIYRRRSRHYRKLLKKKEMWD